MWGTGVVDTNYLKDSELRQVLATDATAKVVLTAQVMGEAMNAGSPENARNELRILSEFPDRVLVAKPLTPVSQTTIRQQRDLMDIDKTAELRRILMQLDQTPDAMWLRIVADAKQRADEHLRRHQEKPAEMTTLLAGIRERWSKADLNVLQKGGTLSEDAAVGMIKEAFALAKFFRSHAGGDEGSMSNESMIDTFAFRYAVCKVAWLVGRMGQGARELQPRIARNDSVDTLICAYATYFRTYYCLDGRPKQTFWLATQMLAHVLSRLRKVTPEYRARFKPGEVPP